MEQKVFLALDWQGMTRAAYKDGAWELTESLQDKHMHCLATDRHHPKRVYAGTRTSGVLRSDDSGITWRSIGLEGKPVKSLTVDPQNPDVIYAGSKPVSIYVTYDGGGRWEELPALRAMRKWWWFSPAEPPGLAPYVQAISVSPGNPDVIACGIELGALMVSEDGGKSWSGHKKGAIRDCHSLKFHYYNSNWAYEGGAGGVGGSFSRDGGNTWQQSRGKIRKLYGWMVAADPERPEVWYLSASGMPNILRGEFVPPAHDDGNAQAHIYRSVGGARLEKLAGGLPDPLDYMAYALEIDPDAPGHLYAGLANGDVWHTTDYGDTWAQMPFNLNAVHRDMVVLG